MASRCLLTLCSLASLLSLLHLAIGNQYTVGDSQGWGLGVDYASWASQYTFQVGDSLTFPYAQGAHSVLQLSQQDFQNCNINNPLASDNSAGNSQVTLNAPGVYFFSCGMLGHCGQGMRVAIPVSQGGGASPSSPGGSSSPVSFGSSSSGAASEMKPGAAAILVSGAVAVTYVCMAL